MVVFISASPTIAQSHRLAPAHFETIANLARLCRAFSRSIYFETTEILWDVITLKRSSIDSIVMPAIRIKYQESETSDSHRYKTTT